MNGKNIRRQGVEKVVSGKDDFQMNLLAKRCCLFPFSSRLWRRLTPQQFGHLRQTDTMRKYSTRTEMLRTHRRFSSLPNPRYSKDDTWGEHRIERLRLQGGDQRLYSSLNSTCRTHHT